MADNAPVEYVMATCQDGRINKFSTTKTHDFICTPMMRLTTVEGQLKGLVTTETCVRADVPVRWNPGALCLHWHPTIHHEYYVGSDEGCIHRCSTNYLNQHMDVFRAHAGPVYDIVISPFMESLIVTCGADNSARLWIEGVDDIIVTLSCSAAVYGAAFCPINATVLLTISGNVLSVWDLRRKTHAPCTDYTFASNTVLTYIRFSKSGYNVIVGETTGRVHTFHLEDMPVAPFYQRRMLEDALRRTLCGRPELIKQLEKLNKL
ncbi:WD repeat-containing protein 78 [Eumeta japonica]|uniref:Dynein axonemal intermediate chain 4 n=1 Tax=Eumeta variegata TaxID=151549 RepID=A0A4C1VQY9_EUMVA|nr:WD repeat-containing protein 78 [Eumeta japonica]